jgi:hypothetical protein
MGFYSLTMLNIALELAKHNPVYERSDRLNGEMLSRPRKPPSKTFSPAESFRLTHLLCGDRDARP